MSERFDPEKLAQTIKKLREQKGLTQQQLAQQAGLSQAQISAMERGTANPTASALDQTAAALEVPTWLLLAGLTFIAIGAILAMLEVSEKK